MFLNIDYAKRAAARENNNIQSSVITSIDDNDDIDYEQLFDDYEIKKPIKRVRFAPIVEENSLTPTLSRSSSIRPTFDVEFDFDSLVSPSQSDKSHPNTNQWKDAFLTDLNLAKKNPSTILNSPSIIQIENQSKEDTLWEFMKESNPKLLEKLERTTNEKSKRIDRFSLQQSLSTNTKSIIPTFEKEIETSLPISSSVKPMSVTEVTLKQPEPSNISIVEIRLENDAFNEIHEELLHFLLPYHRRLCEGNLWPCEHYFTSPNISLQLIRDICDNRIHLNSTTDRSDILKHLMFIYTITSFLYVFAYCSLQTAIRHVENVIVQNMKNVCIDQERGKPLFDLLTKTHQKFENVLHPKILHIKNMLVEFFHQRRQLINTIKQIPEPKFLLLVQYESLDLLHDIERGLSSIIELRSYVYDKQINISRDELNDLLMYNNMIIIRTRQISPVILTRPKRITLVIEYEYGEQIQQWYRFCHQQIISYLAYRTILPLFTAPDEEESMDIDEKKFSPPILKEEYLSLPTIVLARPLVDNFKLLRTLECRHDISIITRDYHLLGIPVDQQPDILIDWTTSMLIFDLNTKLDIHLVQQKIQSMTQHCCHIHVAILTSGSTPDFILSTYITPITQLAKQIQENQANIDIQIQSFSSLDEFANHVAQLVHQDKVIHCPLTPTPSWNEKMLLRRCSSLNSISAQLILQRLKNVDLSTVNLELLINQCPEIPVVYLKIFLSDMHKNA